MCEDNSSQSQPDGRISYREKGATGDDDRPNKRSRHKSKSPPLLSLPPFHPGSPSLNVDSYPLILSQIIEYSSPATLAALARCDKRLFHIAVPRLYQNVRMTRRRLTTMLEAADTLATSSLTYNVPGRAVLQFIYGCLRDARWLHLLDGGSTPRPTSLRSAIFRRLTCVVVYPSMTSVEGHSALVVSADTHRLRAPSLVTRPPDNGQRITEALALTSLRRDTRSVTLLVPNVYWKLHPPACLQLSDHPGRTVTIVLTPSMLPDIPKTWANSAANDAWISGLVELSIDNDVRIVGTEYIGQHFAECCHLIANSREARLLSVPDTQEDRFQSLSFLDWLDEQEPGGLFTEEEEKDLRAADLYMRGGAPLAGNSSGVASAYAVPVADVVVLTDEDSLEDDHAPVGKPADDSDEDSQVYQSADRNHASSPYAKDRRTELRDSTGSPQTRMPRATSHRSRLAKKRVVSPLSVRTSGFSKADRHVKSSRPLARQSPDSYRMERESPATRYQYTPSPRTINKGMGVILSSSPEENGLGPARHNAYLKRSLYMDRATRSPTRSRSPVRRFRESSLSPEGTQEAEDEEERAMLAYA